MNLSGLIIGAATFLVIGAFHPLVIKAEYHLGARCWPLFALAGAAFCVASALVQGQLLSIVLGVLGFSCFWSIIELFQQQKRVERGWFPANPKKRSQK